MARPEFPHLPPEDIKVWKKFLAGHGAIYDDFQYDVRVGTQVRVSRDTNPKIKAMASDLSMKRIDAIAWNKSQPIIFEITHTAGFKAVGQLLGYKFLFDVMFPDEAPAKSILVAGQLLPDMAFILNSLELEYHVV